MLGFVLDFLYDLTSSLTLAREDNKNNSSRNLPLGLYKLMTMLTYEHVFLHSNISTREGKD